MNLENRTFTLSEIEIVSAANAEIDEANDKVDRVTQTIDRLISNLPEAVIRLKRIGSTSLARQIQNDLDNLMYWQKNGGLSEGHYRLIGGASILSDDAKSSMAVYVKVEGSDNEKPTKSGERGVGMELVNGEWFYTEETKSAAIKQHGCNCDSCCAATLLEVNNEK